MAEVTWNKVWTINPDIAGAPGFDYCHIGATSPCGVFLSAANKWVVVDEEGRATPVPMEPLCYWKGALLYHDRRTLVRYIHSHTCSRICESA